MRQMRDAGLVALSLGDVLDHVEQIFRLAVLAADRHALGDHVASTSVERVDDVGLDLELARLQRFAVARDDHVGLFAAEYLVG